MMDKNDSELIERCKGGDRDAWNTLYGRYAAKVRASVAAFNFSRTESEDVCQEVFIDLFKSLPMFRGESSLQTFVLRISKYRCISLYRNKAAKKRGGGVKDSPLEETDSRGDDAGTVARDESPTAEEMVIMKEEGLELLERVESLSPDCRKIIRLRYFGELSYSELCERLGMPMGTLCSKLKRCLDYLRRLYPGCGGKQV